MRMYLVSSLVAVSLLSACGGPLTAEDAASERSQSLTATDVDVPPECAGILTFVNTATFTTLDVYLPSHTASNIVGARPFSTLAALSAVNSVGAARLTEIHSGATAEGFISSTCVGIFDELAVSADDQAAMVSLVNAASDSELHTIMPYAWNGAVNLLALRPYTTALAISATSGIGAVAFRNLRNAATLSRPFEQLAAAVNGLHGQARLERHFDWYNEVQNAIGSRHLNGVTCFGVDPQYLPNGSEIRPNLADAAEVVAQTTEAVAYAQHWGTLPVDPAIGLGNLSTLAQGKTFFGCYVQYANDPWSGHTLRVFVDTVSGLSVLADSYWAE